ncbi:phosphoenolpyruvate synthase, partial [Acidithiobacillus ferrooxidans]|nr:phosphoenolpyruvate synthase [Acidithiobacillus ferrooxidans]
KIKMIYTEGDTRHSTRNIATHRREQDTFCLSDADVLTLADYAIKVEQHYSRKMQESRPMDMEWAKDGIDGQLYMVQARPETVASQKKGQVLEEYILDGQGPALIQGRAIGGKIASGPVRVIRDVKHLADFRPGEILVADITT